jgi:hypothetical protein
VGHNQFEKSIKQRRDIVRARARFRVALEAESWFVGAFHRLQTAVKQ